MTIDETLCARTNLGARAEAVEREDGPCLPLDHELTLGKLGVGLACDRERTARIAALRLAPLLVHERGLALQAREVRRAIGSGRESRLRTRRDASRAHARRLVRSDRRGLHRCGCGRFYRDLFERARDANGRLACGAWLFGLRYVRGI